MAGALGATGCDGRARFRRRPAGGWSFGDSIYFSFVSGLTIGYGDLAPKTGLGRLLAVGIGISGVLLTALVAAVAVEALTFARGRGDE